MITTINPATGEKIAEFEVTKRKQVEEAVVRAKDGFRVWSLMALKERASYLKKMAVILRRRKQELSELVTVEMGKPIKESISEVEKCAWALEYYATEGPRFLMDEAATTNADKSFIAFEPLGVIGSIMPWNFPLWQALRFGAPALMAGNTVLLKPSSITPQCGLEIEKTVHEAGLPDGCFQTLVGDSTTAEAMLDAPIDAFSFTGSVETGAKVAQRATGRLKKIVLELGGSDPFIVCHDADLDVTTTGAVRGRFINCGQSCIASKRFFVVKKAAREFTEEFLQKTRELKVGDPLDKDTDIGPMVREDALEFLDDQVKDALVSGVRVLVGGRRLKRKGFFYEPTILVDVRPEMRVMKEETFGPVAPVMIVENEERAVEEANASDFGLGASIWSNNLRYAEKLARRIEAGLVSINHVVASDPRVPFGGIKQSGFGRELSRYGILEFTNIKSVRVYRPARLRTAKR